MSSVHPDRNGWRIGFYFRKIKRTLWIGKPATKKHAQAFAAKLDRLIGSLNLGLPLDPDVKQWIDGMDAKYRSKLEAWNMVEKSKDIPLREFVETYVINSEMSDSNQRHITEAVDCLIGLVGESRKITQVTPADAILLCNQIRAKYKTSTAGRRVKRFQQIFEKAVMAKFIDQNPFSGMDVSSDPDQERKYYVSREMFDKILSHVHSTEMKAAFMLARYGGLRTPSEQLELTWKDIDLGSKKIAIRSKKLKGTSKYNREIPIFKELVDILSLLALCTVEQPFPSYHASAAVSYRKILLKAIKAAGFEPWEKLFVNLRASCRTDLEACGKYSEHAINYWMGHSSQVGQKHYSMITEDVWNQATK